MLDPFQPGPGFGNFSGSASGRAGFNGAGSPGGSGADRLGACGFNLAGLACFVGSLGARAPRYQLNSGVTTGRNVDSKRSTATVPPLAQLIHGGFNLPPNPSFVPFRLLSQDRYARGGNGTGLDFSRMIATGMFTTSDLGNGVRFSAGAGQSIAHGSAGGGKLSGPSVALKLSF